MSIAADRHGVVQRRAARAAGAIALSMACGMSLCACLGPTGYPAFEQEQTEDDLIPAEFVEYFSSSIDLDTTRYSGSYDGLDYYMARGLPTSAQLYCVLAVGEGANSSGCSSGGAITLEGPSPELGRSSFEVQLLPMPAISIDDWISLSDNVRVRATDSGGNSGSSSEND